MPTYRFVWRKADDALKGDWQWYAKHIIAKNTADALSKIERHLHAKKGNATRLELDHLFFEIGFDGLHGSDRKDFTLLPQFVRSDRTLVESNLIGITIVST
jgi:hypothetical protein